MGLRKGQTNSGSFKKGNVSWCKGKRLSDEHRKKLVGSHGRGYYFNKEGYKRIYVGQDLSGKSRFLSAHQVAWCEANNICFIPFGCQIHHLDENKNNNSPENLMLVSKSIHTELHWMTGKTHGGGD
jgi:hypothetical protein